MYKQDGRTNIHGIIRGMNETGKIRIKKEG
jgi:hypothetical protein